MSHAVYFQAHFSESIFTLTYSLNKLPNTNTLLNTAFGLECVKGSVQYTFGIYKKQ